MSKLVGWENEIKQKNIISIQVNLLNKCPSRCKSCRKYEWPDNQLDVDIVKKALKYLKEEKGLQTVVFSGGDPLMYKQLPELIDFCYENGIEYSLITTLITKDGELLRKIANTAYRIHVSLDSVYCDRYFEIRGVDALNLVFENIAHVNKIRLFNGDIPIRLSSTISVMNYSEVYDLYEYAKNAGCLINFYLVHTWEDLKMSDRQLKKFYKDLKKVAKDEQRNKKTISNAKSLLAERYDFTSESDKCNVCYLPHISCTIDSDGSVYPCCKLLNDNGEYGEQLRYAYGSIKNENLEEEFNKRFNRKYPNDSICKECAQRYDGLLRDIEKIVENKKEPIFF